MQSTQPATAYEVRTATGAPAARSLSSLDAEYDAVMYRRQGMDVTVVTVVRMPWGGWAVKP